PTRAPGGVVIVFALTDVQSARLVFAVVIAYAALVALRGALHGRDTAQRVASAHRYLAQRGLATGPDMVALTLRYQAANFALANWLMFGFLIVMGNVVVFWTYLPGVTLLHLGVPLMTPLALLVASARVLLLHGTSPPPDTPRVAHAARASINDY